MRGAAPVGLLLLGTELARGGLHAAARSRPGVRCRRLPGQPGSAFLRRHQHCRFAFGAAPPPEEIPGGLGATPGRPRRASRAAARVKTGRSLPPPGAVSFAGSFRRAAPAGGRARPQRLHLCFGPGRQLPPVADGGPVRPARARHRRCRPCGVPQAARQLLLLGRRGEAG